MHDLGFSSIEEICEVLHKISDQFEEDSDEVRALTVAANALLCQTMERTRKQFEEFLVEHPIEDITLTAWIEANPTAPIGTTTFLHGAMHVVTAEPVPGSQLQLVRVRNEWLTD
ncbi:MAG: hypothetical protein COA78_24120 [Blastopirellula sp.]|nr:MAG: hypothetical protein COA78_24120 [Blastopirellula sp.]